MSETKYPTDHVEQADRPRRRGGVKNHCARFWWLHIIIFCIVFLIIALCLVYVGMPRIAQKDVNDTTLEFTELQFLYPTANSITLTQKATLHNPARYTPTLDTFSAGVYLVTNGTFGPTTLIHVQMPSIHSLHPSTETGITNQTVPVDNMDELTKYTTAVVSQEYVETALVGKTKLHLGKLPTTTITYNSTSRYKTLNGLKGFNVTNTRINLAATPGEPNLSGIAFIPNPSQFTIEMGNVTMLLSTAGSGVVGNSTINNMTIKPGNNTYPLTGAIDNSKVLHDLDKDGNVNLLITGQNVTSNGEHLIYYEKALAANVLTLKMNVNQVLKDSAKPPTS